MTSVASHAGSGGKPTKPPQAPAHRSPGNDAPPGTPGTGEAICR